MTLGEARTAGAARLVQANADSPSLDATLLLSRVTGLDKARILTHADRPMSAADLDRYLSLIARRAAGECVAYILGSKEFRGLDFLVSPAVLVPRADTETLVEAALDWLDRRSSAVRGQPPRVLDACTGSGCIAVSIKAERPSAEVFACDLSHAALGIARKNAERLLGGTDRVSFYEGDLLAPVPGFFDLIVANPPYVPEPVIATLSREVQGEPRMALDGGEDGLDLIRRLVSQAHEKLSSGGRLLIEAGHDQSHAVAALMRKALFINICAYRDLSGIDRVTGGTKP